MSAIAPFARPRRCRRAGALGLAALLALHGAGATERAALPEDLTQLSLDDLLQIEVTTVSKRAEPLLEAAAAVVVITGEDLQRRGVSSIAEALREVPGLHVARSGQSYAISARGFNSTSADKLEVLLDGRSVYTPLFSGVFWDVLDTYLPDIERIEVIRGPGATLWGANAVNGVINIVTRRAADTLGTQVQAAGGNHDHAQGSARHGWRLGEHGHARVYAQYRGNDNGVRADGSEPPNGFVLRQAGVRGDFTPTARQQLMFSSDWYDGTVESANGDGDVEGGHLLAGWQLRQSARAQLGVTASLSHSRRDIPTIFEERRDTWDLELEQHLGLGQRHELLFGLGYRRSDDDTGGPPRAIIFEPAARRLETYDGFVQDQIRLGDRRGTLTLGSKFEHNDFTGFEYQPSAHLGWNLRERLFAWAGISRAVRTPNRLDSDIAIFCPPPAGFPGLCGPGRFRIGNPELDAETLIAYETGLRLRPSPRLLLALALFHNDYDHLRSQEPATPFIRFGNGLQGTGTGGEFNLTWQPRDPLRLSAFYSYLDLDIRRREGSGDRNGARAIEDGNPHHLAGGVLAWTPAPRWSLDAFLRYVGELPASKLPDYTELNLRLAWRPRPDLELALLGENLLDGQHPEFGANTPNRIEVQRQGLLQLRWWSQ